MAPKRQTWIFSSIVAGSGEGIPASKSTANRVVSWSLVVLATIANPALTVIAVQRQLWYSMTALLSVFASQLVLICWVRKQSTTGQAKHLRLLAIVLVTNALTYGIGHPIFKSLNQSAISFMEIQVLLSVLYFVFGPGE